MRHLSLIRAALVLLAASGLGGCISTATYGTGEAPETVLLHEATGGLLGLMGEEEKPEIDYEPRAALVIPPAAQLPEPAPPPAELAAGAWPMEQVEEGEVAAIVGEDDGTDRSAMSPDYIRRMKQFGQLTDSTRRSRVRMNETGAAQSFASDPRVGDQYQQFQTALDERDGLSRPQRRYLTDPPSHYREPAATAQAEFEDIEKKEKGFFARIFGR